MEKRYTEDEIKEKLKEYRLFTRTVAVYPKEHGILYCALGLQNEVGEYIGKLESVPTAKDIVAEAGDIMWYIARLLDELGINIEDVLTVDLEKEDNPEPNLDPVYVRMEWTLLQMESQLGEFYGTLKKSIRGDSKLDKEKLVKEIQTFYETFESMLRLAGYDVPYIIDYNVNKLTSRKNRGVVKGDGDHR